MNYESKPHVIQMLGERGAKALATRREDWNVASAFRIRSDPARPRPPPAISAGVRHMTDVPTVYQSRCGAAASVAGREDGRTWRTVVVFRVGLRPVDGAAVRKDRLVTASTDKYGYSPGRDAYAAGVWALQPRRVLAWNDLSKDASRFRFVTDV
jgi:hypothetical protein